MKGQSPAWWTVRDIGYAFCSSSETRFVEHDNALIESYVSVSGLKPGQRKVLFCCFKRNDKREVKVAQLAGSVAEMSAYHHGEVRGCFFIATTFD